MSKGIIVVDNPKECSSCRFSQQLNKIDEPGYCWLADNGEEIWAGKRYKPGWCPIRSMTKEVEMQLFREGKR